MIGDAPPGFVRGRDAPLATVGMFAQPEWGGGFFATFEPGEVVRVRVPIPSIVVQSLGRPLPPFASASLFIDAWPDYELDVIYDAPWLAAEPAAAPTRFAHVKPRTRLVLCDETLAAGLARAGSLPPADIVIAAEAAGLAGLAEALALVLTGNLLIGLDLSEMLAMAGPTSGQGARARAVLLPGRGDAAMVAPLRAWISQAATDGFDGGLLVIQLAAEDESERLTLAELDVFFQAVAGAEGRPALATASVEASVTAVAVVVFPRIRA